MDRVEYVKFQWSTVLFLADDMLAGGLTAPWPATATYTGVAYW
ncbi:hypothetical protein [Paeniglutamicibacter antarcticus]